MIIITTASIFTYNLITAYLRPNAAPLLGVTDLAGCLAFWLVSGCLEIKTLLLAALWAQLHFAVGFSLILWLG